MVIVATMVAVVVVTALIARIIMVSAIIVAVLVLHWPRRMRWCIKLVCAFDYLVQFAPIKPHTAASRAIVDLHSLAFGNS